MGIVDAQLEALQRLFPGASAEALSNGATLVTVPDVRLPDGWSQASATVSFLVPVGYPMAKPDCFYTDPELRLRGAGMPANTGINGQPIPDKPEPRLWFSWHLASWNPNRDSLLTYVRVVQDRFAQVR